MGTVRFRSGARPFEKEGREAAARGDHLRAARCFSRAAKLHAECAITWSTLGLGFAIAAVIFAVIGAVT